MNKWSFVKYLNPADHNPRRITKTDNLPKSLIHKIKKNNSININVFGYENKEKHPIYVSNWKPKKL